MNNIVETFQEIAIKAIEMKSHGLGTKKIIKYIKSNPEGSIQAFFDRYESTKERFKKRDASLISGSFWMRPKAEKEATWTLLEKCRDLSLRYQMMKGD